MHLLSARRLVTKAILFDLGNTLVGYYQRDEFQPILQQAVDRIQEELSVRGISKVSGQAAMESALNENREARDCRFYPLANRLEKIFDICLNSNAELSDSLCRKFLEPIFATGNLYKDSISSLKILRDQEFKLGIVSNLPWGSPPELWREELNRIGLSELVDSVTLCGDVGWRKPAKQIFEIASQNIGVPCAECIFIGDEPTWDIEGSEAVGMRAILMDRSNRYTEYEGERVGDLRSFLSLLAHNN